MPYCPNCNNIISSNDRFCSRCGASFAVNAYENRHQVFEGELRKCPNCGGTLNAFDRKCKDCGYDISGSIQSLAIIGFVNTINMFEARRPSNSGLGNQIKKALSPRSIEETDKQIANHIRAFSVPNNKIDLFDFLNLAASSIDVNYLSRNTPSNENAAYDFYSKRYVVKAWKDKFDQVYKQAKLLLERNNDSDFEILKNIYDTKNAEIKRATKRTRIIKIIGIIILASIIGYFIIPGKLQKRKLEKEFVIIQQYIDDKQYDEALEILNNQKIKYHMFSDYFQLKDEHEDLVVDAQDKILQELLKEIENDIENKQYKEAIQKCNNLHMNIDFYDSKSLEWDKRRKELLEEIMKNDSSLTKKERIEIMHIIGVTDIEIPESSKNLEGENYLNVVKLLESSGFMNVSVEAIPDLSTGWLTDDGEVEEVSINGKTKYKKGEKFNFESEIVIKYHTFKDK